MFVGRLVLQLHKILHVHFSLRVLSGSANASKIWSAKLFNSTSLSNLISPSQLAGYYERKDNYNNVMIMVVCMCPVRGVYHALYE